MLRFVNKYDNLVEEYQESVFKLVKKSMMTIVLLSRHEKNLRKDGISIMKRWGIFCSHDVCNFPTVRWARVLQSKDSGV